MRPKWFVGLMIGILLLYLGFMGASGVGFSFTSMDTLPAHEEFSDLSSWSSYMAGSASTPIISPSGQVQLQAGTGSGDERCAIRSRAINAMSSSLNPKLTVTISMKADNWASSGDINWQIYSDTWYIAIDVQHNAIVAGLTTLTHTNDNAFHTYTMSIDGSAKTCAFGSDGTQIGVFPSSCFGAGVAASYLGISLDANNGLLCHIDYCYIDAGTTSPVSNSYSLTVSGQDNNGGTLSVPITVTDSGGSAVGPRNTPATFGPYSANSVITITAASSATVGSQSYTFLHWNDDWTNKSPTRTYTITAEATLTATYVIGNAPTAGAISVTGSSYPFDCWYSGSSNHVTVTGAHTFSNVPTGSQTVYGTYNGVTKSQTVTVTDGNTANVYLDFSTPPDIFGNFTAFIRAELNNSNVRQFEMVIGGLTALISGVIFVLPESKRQQYYRPPPPGYYG